MENKENRGLADQISYEDQFVPFFSLVLELPLSILSHTHSWRLKVFLDHSSIGSRKEKEGLRRKILSEEEQHIIATVGLFSTINLHVCFPC